MDFIDPLIRDAFVKEGSIKEGFAIDTFAASFNDVELPCPSRA
jgi:hypothetical protein